MDREQFLGAVGDMADQVWDFHERWGFWPFSGPEQNPAEAISNRDAILLEEVRELSDAVTNETDAEIAGEAADVLFVAMGHVLSLKELGIEGVESVTRKNSNKTEKTHRIRPDTGKLLPIEGKPHKWR